MNPNQTKRSAMLNTIYNMLPGIDNDYAAKLVYTLENKKTIAQLQQDIADLAAQLSSDSAMTDSMIAKMLLDECTLPAALRQLRIYNNSTSITELCAALNLPATQTSQLLGIYASFSSHQYFDEAFEKALQETQEEGQSDEEKVRSAVAYLLQQAQHLYDTSRPIITQNKTDIFTVADKYHISVKLTAQLVLLYSQPGSIAFKPAFENLFQQILLQNNNEPLAASLAARVLLCQLTPKDAQQTAQAALLLGNQLLEEDLCTIACRYLKLKTPQDIADTFEGVLKKLPYVDDATENLDLAVRVLVDGTPESFSDALQQASFKRDTTLLHRALAQHPHYAPYAYELARRFGGKQSFAQVDQQINAVLQTLPYCVRPDENADLACQTVLGTLTRQEATRQAADRCNLKASDITRGLVPGLLKNYTGTKTASQVSQLLEKTLAGYTFWKNDREKHLFALRLLIEELNGTYTHAVSQAVLDLLEQAVALPAVTDLLSQVRGQNPTPQILAKLSARCRENAQPLPSVEKTL